MLQTKTFQTGDYAYQSWSNGYVIALTLTEESTDVASNTSLVSYLFTISNTDNNQFYSNDYSWAIYLAGQQIDINNFNFYVYPYNTTQTIVSGQITVPHNADGTLDMTYDVSIPNTQAYVSYGAPAMSLAGTWTLTPIARTSVPTVSASTAEVGETVTIYTNRTIDGATHILHYTLDGGTTWHHIANSVIDSYEWKLDETVAQNIDGTEASCHVDCKTFIGQTKVGEKTVHLTITMPAVTTYIDTGSKLELFRAYIDNGTEWELYQPHIDDTGAPTVTAALGFCVLGADALG